MLLLLLLELVLLCNEKFVLFCSDNVLLLVAKLEFVLLLALLCPDLNPPRVLSPVNFGIPFTALDESSGSPPMGARVFWYELLRLVCVCVCVCMYVCMLW